MAHNDGQVLACPLPLVKIQKHIMGFTYSELLQLYASVQRGQVISMHVMI